MKRFLLGMAAACGLLYARADTVLVVPFFNLTGSANLDWIGESAAEAIRESVDSQGLLVLGREARNQAFGRLSLRYYAPLTRASIMKLGETLDAALVIYGQIAWKGDPAASQSAPKSLALLQAPPAARQSIVITARILDLKSMKQGPEYAESGVLEDLAALETHLAWQSLQFLAPKTAPSDEEFRKAHPPIRVDAKESYIRGLLAAGEQQKHKLYTQAARLDPRFSAPAFQLGRMYAHKKEYGVAAGWLEKVTPADSYYLEARFLLGVCSFHNADYAKADAAFSEVSAKVPLNEVFNNWGAVQSRMRATGDLDNFRKALDGDQADADYHFNVGYALWRRGKFDDAAGSFRAVLDRNPEDSEAMTLLGRCLKQSGPRRGDSSTEGRERLKLNYDESGYRQLKAELESRR